VKAVIITGRVRLGLDNHRTCAISDMLVKRYRENPSPEPSIRVGVMAGLGCGKVVV
jgi:hypothetical protein